MAKPVLVLMVPIAVLELRQVMPDADVILAVEASEYVAMAVNCCVLPTGTEAVDGVTAIDCSVLPAVEA